MIAFFLKSCIITPMKVVSKMVLNDKEKIPETFLFQLYNREYQREVNEINYQFFENDTYFNREEL